MIKMTLFIEIKNNFRKYRNQYVDSYRNSYGKPTAGENFSLPESHIACLSGSFSGQIQRDALAQTCGCRQPLPDSVVYLL